MLVGLALAIVLIAEVYLAASAVAFSAGRVMLGSAIALEACSRAIGTVSRRARRRAGVGLRLRDRRCAQRDLVRLPAARAARTDDRAAALAGLLAGLAARARASAPGLVGGSSFAR